jgi:hypothetical protein
VAAGRAVADEAGVRGERAVGELAALAIVGEARDGAEVGVDDDAADGLVPGQREAGGLAGGGDVVVERGELAGDLGQRRGAAGP